MTPSPWNALADALEALAHTLRALPGVSPAPLPPVQPVGAWLTIRQFSANHPAFGHSTIRQLVAARCANGLLAQGIVKEVLQRKIVVHEARLLAWLLHEPLPQHALA